MGTHGMRITTGSRTRRIIVGGFAGAVLSKECSPISHVFLKPCRAGDVCECGRNTADAITAASVNASTSVASDAAKERP